MIFNSLRSNNPYCSPTAQPRPTFSHILKCSLTKFPHPHSIPPHLTTTTNSPPSITHPKLRQLPTARSTKNTKLHSFDKDKIEKC
ncbi:MAG: hypothetical protein LBQ31_06615 [Bacteroidales bacterium]|nr:hypothetical protein [Bacteroidales bacterium]